MTPAYNEAYLYDSMNNLGEAFDYAANACGMELDTFMGLFLASGYADLFGRGVPKVVSGLSGTELVLEIAKKAGLSRSFPPPQIEYDCSPEYWCGYILAYFQWKTGRTFEEIQKSLPVLEVLRMYPALHEASEDKFVDTANAVMQRRNPATRLQRRRKLCGFTQMELAEKSGVKLRTLQQYETRKKDINKASAMTLESLAFSLCCGIEDLLEFPANQT